MDNVLLSLWNTRRKGNTGSQILKTKNQNQKKSK